MSSLCFGSLDNAKVCASGRVLFDVRTAGRVWVLYDGGEEESVEEVTVVVWTVEIVGVEAVDIVVVEAVDIVVVDVEALVVEVVDIVVEVEVEAVVDSTVEIVVVEVLTMF